MPRLCVDLVVSPLSRDEGRLTLVGQTSGTCYVIFSSLEPGASPAQGDEAKFYEEERVRLHGRAQAWSSMATIHLMAWVALTTAQKLGGSVGLS